MYAKFEAQSTPKKGYIRVEPIDTTLNATSKKPLQNKAIYAALALKFDSADLTRKALVTLLGDATLFANGLMSALDKQNLAQTILDIQSLFSDVNELELEKEDKENKRADLENSNNTTYPTTKAVKDELDLKVDSNTYNQKSK